MKILSLFEEIETFISQVSFSFEDRVRKQHVPSDFCLFVDAQLSLQK